jgi:hypothetical protein
MNDTFTRSWGGTCQCHQSDNSQLDENHLFRTIRVLPVHNVNLGWQQSFKLRNQLTVLKGLSCESPLR